MHAQRVLGDFAGGEPTLVDATGAERDGAPGVDAWADAHLEFPSGATGLARCSMTSDHWDMSLRVIGTQRARRTSPTSSTRSTTTGSSSSPRAGERTEHCGNATSYTYQLEAFIDAVRHGAPYRTDADDAVTTMALIDSCYRSIGLQPRPAYAEQLVTHAAKETRPMTTSTASRTTGWLSAADCSIDDFRTLVGQQTDLADYPYADAVERNVLIYGEKLRDAVGSAAGRTAVQTELIRALTDGPGIVVFKRAFGDLSVVDRATEAFLAQIAAEKAAGTTAGDHFAKPGANDRVWGALDKLAVADPAVFADYYANDVIALISEAWLGPGLPGHLPGQRGQPRRPGADRAP